VEERKILPILDLAQAKPATRYFTTLHDNQPKALFHFYLRPNKTDAQWLSVGSVFLEGLRPAPAGQPTFELRLGPESSGDILLELLDRSSGMRKRLLFLASQLAAGIPPGARSRLADLEPPAAGHVLRARGRDSAKRLPEHPGRQPQRRGRPRKLLLAVAAFVSAALVILIVLLLTTTGGFVRRPAARLQAAEKVEQAPAGGSLPDAPKGEGSTDEEDAQPGREEEPGAAGTAGAAEAVLPGEAGTEDQQGVGQGGESLHYRIHWGDTLWGITERYYGNAELYPLLARENAIANPHLLIAGTEIRLPPKIDEEDRKDAP
jgi:nucleoid-associated protein YgaU